MWETAGGHHHFTVSFFLMLVTVLKVSSALKVCQMPTLYDWTKGWNLLSEVEKIAIETPLVLAQSANLLFSPQELIKQTLKQIIFQVEINRLLSSISSQENYIMSTSHQLLHSFKNCFKKAVNDNLLRVNWEIVISVNHYRDVCSFF